MKNCILHSVCLGVSAVSDNDTPLIESQVKDILRDSWFCKCTRLQNFIRHPFDTEQKMHKYSSINLLLLCIDTRTYLFRWFWTKNLSDKMSYNSSYKKIFRLKRLTTASIRNGRTKFFNWQGFRRWQGYALVLHMLMSISLPWLGKLCIT